MLQATNFLASGFCETIVRNSDNLELEKALYNMNTDRLVHKLSAFDLAECFYPLYLVPATASLGAHEVFFMFNVQ